ncbi:MAG TPA: von Willebrand factor type A domain-containing protein, partial [Luteolibacter sp.]
PADPRITAYAFGELEGDELRLIEAAVQADPALQSAVAELRGFGDTLSSVLGDESIAAVPAQAIKPEPSPQKARRRLIPFPLYYLATAAAACFALVVCMRYETTPSAHPATKTKNVAAFSSEVAPSPAQALAPAVTEAPQPAPSPVAFSSVALPEMPAAEVKFDKSLAVGAATDGGRVTAKAANAPIVASPVAAPPRAQSDSIASEMRRREAREMPAPASVYLQRSADVSAGLGGVVMAPPQALAAGFMDKDARVAGEAYVHANENGYHVASTEPLSTFSIDVDTASYSNVRRFLAGGRLPPRDAVRVEELINYFPYGYAPPLADAAKNAAPFAAHLEVASAPWAPAHRLVRIGIKGRELTAATRPPANLVFLLDVSGSMNQPNKLPLVKESLRLLVEHLRPDDRVAIVTYAGNSGLALPSTPASQKREILASLDSLRPGGGTNGAMGIHLAYDIAKANFTAGGINRVILCTDGDFNVGVTHRDELTSLVAEKAKSRVFLSVFGFGMGNYKDATLESLADKGNGAYGYIDTRREAEKVFVEQAEGTLATIAKDVKIQVEFNPARVQSYRLIGYENRILAKEDFNNDAVDAGDIGAGHTVTALYEIVPVGMDDDTAPRPTVDPLKYQKTEAGSRKPEAGARRTESRELLTVKIRYKAPEGDVSAKQEFPLIDGGRRFEQASDEFRFASAVAAWGMLLRGSPNTGSASFEQVQAWAENALGDDEGGYRSEFIQLVRRSAELSP